MTYKRIESPEDLPPEGPLDERAREKQDLDFKTFVDGRRKWEPAKDIAAFANALGGVLLIGADDQSTPTMLQYPGVAGQTVADVKRIYEEAGILCSPAQNVDVVPIKGPRNVDLVAVNIDASIDQVVASPGGHQTTGILTSLWRFPIRRASQTDDLAPQDLAMFMNRQARRAFLLLSEIPVAQREKVAIYYPKSSAFAFEYSLRLADVPRERNHFVLANEPAMCRVPLGDVLDVWEKDEGVWAIKVSGSVEFATTPTGQPVMRYRPRY